MDIVHIEQQLYYRTCLIFVRDGCEIQLVSYGSKHASQSLSDMRFVSYKHNMKPTDCTCIEMFCISNDCSAIRDIPCVVRVAWEIWLEGYNFRHTSVVLWYNIVRIYSKSVHISLFGLQLCKSTKLTYLMTAHNAPNDDFTANNTSFHKNKFG